MVLQVNIKGHYQSDLITEQLKCFMQNEDEDTLVVQGTANNDPAPIQQEQQTDSDSPCIAKDQGQNHVDADIESDGSDDDYDDSDDFDVTSKPRAVERVVKKHISFPVMLTLIDPDLDVVHFTRLLMCQVITCHSNSKARSAVENHQYIDFANTGILLVPY